MKHTLAVQRTKQLIAPLRRPNRRMTTVQVAAEGGAVKPVCNGTPWDLTIFLLCTAALLLDRQCTVPTCWENVIMTDITSQKFMLQYGGVYYAVFEQGTFSFHSSVYFLLP